MPNRPYFDTHRDEGWRRCGVGRARRAADRRIRLRLEPAGRGRDPQAARGQRQGPRRDPRRRQHRAYPAQQHRSLDRGRRRAVEHQDEASLPDRSRRCARRSTCWWIAPRCTSTSTAAPGSTRPTTSTPPRSSSRRTPSYEFNIDKAIKLLDDAGWKPGADGIRAKNGVKLKAVYQTSINAPRQKTQAIVKQACQKAGIDDRDQVGHRVGVLLVGRRQPGHLSALRLRPADVHDDDDAAGPRRCSCGSSCRAKWRARRTSSRAATSPAGRARNTTSSTRRARSELDPVKRAALFIAMNDLLIKNVVVIPVVTRPERGGGGEQPARAAERLGQQYLRAAGLVSRRLKRVQSLAMKVSR